MEWKKYDVLVNNKIENDLKDEKLNKDHAIVIKLRLCHFFV